MRYLPNALAAILVLLSLVQTHTSSGQESVIYNFANDGVDGTNPNASLFLDAKGNLFGTTEQGGPLNVGTVFELSPTEGGGWAEKVIHEFSSSPGDGMYPLSTLVPDARGNLYGTTFGGGSHMSGTVFELSPAAGGKWTEKILYSFGSSAADGNAPTGGLVFDPRGNLYGTTYGGGLVAFGGNGTVFELTPSNGGASTEKVLYSFGATSTDGISPQAGLAIDAAGNLYGTTFQGGTASGGTAFELKNQGSGQWTETVIHNFVPSPDDGPLGYPVISGDGSNPASNLILDNSGNLYGTTSTGTTIGFTGPEGIGAGAVFELSPVAGGAWTEKIVFLAAEATPISGLTMDSLGQVYGTSPTGGSYFGVDDSEEGSIVFQVFPDQGNQEVVYNLPSTQSDGYDTLDAGVILGSQGTLYGATFLGGTNGYGTVFEIGGVGPSIQVGTTVSLAAAPGTSFVAGEPITLMATVTADSGPAIPSGTVTFTDPAGGSVKVLLIAGQAVYYGKVPPVGNYSVYASYSGDPRFGASTSATINGTVTAQ